MTRAEQGAAAIDARRSASPIALAAGAAAASWRPRTDRQAARTPSRPAGGVPIGYREASIPFSYLTKMVIRSATGSSSATQSSTGRERATAASSPSSACR